LCVCAQVEIDEYRDYEKALGALRESQKYLEKASGSHITELALVLDERIQIISKFVDARRLAKKDPSEMVNICQELLREPRVEDAIRIGDCLAMLVEFFHANGKMREAFGYMKQMTDKNIQLNPYLDSTIIEEVYKAVGVSSKGVARPASNGSDGGGGGERMVVNSRSDDEDSVGEEIDEVTNIFIRFGHIRFLMILCPLGGRGRLS
jgi:intraflagellar transport protein 140